MLAAKRNEDNILRHCIPSPLRRWLKDALIGDPYAELDWRNPREFCFAGRRLPYLFHPYNAGWPPVRCTERIVELAIADDWLKRLARSPSGAAGSVPPVVEIGAVTPFYWPGRIERIVDPVDPCDQVTDHLSMFDVDFTGMNVLCLSTIEHIGKGDYGFQEVGRDRDAPAALKQLIAQSASLLITFPTGYNEPLDRAILHHAEWFTNCQLHYLVRQNAWQWQEVTQRPWPIQPYGSPDYANGLVVIERHWKQP